MTVLQAATPARASTAKAVGRLFLLNIGAGQVLSINSDGSGKKVLVSGAPLPDGIVVDVEAGILECVRLQLRRQPDAPAFLILIDHEPPALSGDCRHRDLQLLATVAAEGAEHFTGDALRMHSQQWGALAHVAKDDGQRTFDGSAAVLAPALESHGTKHTPPGWKRGGDHP